MEYASGNIYIRKNPMKKGQIVPSHAHSMDHTTIFFSGSFRVRAVTPEGNRVKRDFTAPDSCLIKKEVLHEIECLEDGEFWCVYSHVNAQGEIVQEYTGLWDPPRG